MLSIKDFPGVACKVKATPAGSYHSALDSAALVRSLNCSLNIKTCAHIIVCVVLLFLLQPNGFRNNLHSFLLIGLLLV